jgi:osmoprotectant transport system substrate-binding protein
MRHPKALRLVALLLLLAACGSGDDPTMSGAPGGGAKPKIVVGAKQTVTEDRLLGTMAAKLLQVKGIPVEYRELYETDNVRRAQEQGQLDLYWEYTGTALSKFFKVEEVISDPQRAWELARDMDAPNGIVWLKPAPLNDANGLAVRAGEIGRTLSELSAWMKTHPDTKWCTLDDFRVRPDGMPQLEKVYGLKPTKLTTMRYGPLFDGIGKGDCDVIQVFTTDARLNARKLTLLDDDRRALPVYNPAPTVRKAIADAYPNLQDLLAPLADKLDTPTMTRLNGKVDIDLVPIDKVAHDFLSSEGLL